MSHFNRCIIFLFTALLTHESLASQKKYLQVKLGVYADKECRQLKDASAIIEIDTSQPCQTIYYIDEQGNKTPATMGRYRCYPDKLVFDKYPMQENCNSKSLVRKSYTIPMSVCQAAPSHDGTVYEKLIDYHYPGSIECMIQPNTLP